jgi:hypothetical protein
MRNNRVLWLAATLALLDGSVFELAGGQTPGSPRTFAAPKPPVELPAFTPEREAAALAFVQQHHAELGEVLAHLKKLNRDQYEQAIRQLFLEIEKLTLVQSNDEKLHALMLESWKVNSRIEVLAARLAAAREKSPEQEAELKKLLYRQVDLHRQQIEHNRERTLATLKVMEANIKLLEEKRDEMVDRRFRNLTGGKKKAP